MTFKYIDVHTHVHASDYGEALVDVLERAKAAKIGLINVGTGIVNSEEVVALAALHENMWATVGIHPVDDPTAVFDYDDLKQLAENPKVVAIGECGLDYFRLVGEATLEKKRQRELLIAQLDLARELKLPVMLHIRNAYADTYEVLKQYPEVTGNIHFFAGTVAEAKLFLDLGYTLSFTGVVTFAKEYEEVVRFCPLDRLLAETDAPYVAPVPMRGKQNEPAYVTYTVAKLAELRGMPVEALKPILVANAVRTFNLK